MTRMTPMKIAASACALGAALVSGQQTAIGAGVVAGSPKALKQAVVEAAKVDKLLKAGKRVEAVTAAEAAVAASPRDVAYRLLLADTYLQSGRFISAETAFVDVLTLQPKNGRASLSLALVRIALGQGAAGVAVLENAEGDISAADGGLALALAGRLDAAIGVLEPAARMEGASAKTRQNLALSYALAGRWTEARAVAQQDVSPDLVDRHLAAWAAFAQPQRSWDQVAALLGVTPTLDRGQPRALALAPVTVAPVVQLVAAPKPVLSPVEAPAPVEIAIARPVVVPAPVAKPVLSRVEGPAPVVLAAAPVAVRSGVVFAPRQAVIQAVPASLIKAAATPAKQRVAIAAAKPTAPAFTAPAASRSGRFVVQLGAYDSAKMAEWGWQRAVARHKVLGNYRPTGETLGAHHRVAAGGFASHRDAALVCGQVRKTGGTCFVRAATGQAPAQWAVKAGTKFAAR